MNPPIPPNKPRFSATVEITGISHYLVKWRLNTSTFKVKDVRNDTNVDSKILRVPGMENCKITLILRYEDRIFTLLLKAGESIAAHLEYAYIIVGYEVYCLVKCAQFQFPAKWLTSHDILEIPDLAHSSHVILNCMIKLKTNNKEYAKKFNLQEMQYTGYYAAKLAHVLPTAEHPSIEFDLEDQLIDNFQQNGEIPHLTVSRAIEIVRRCSTRCIRDLAAICVQHLFYNLNEQSVLQILKLATDLDIEDLTRESLQFLQNECEIHSN